MKIRIFPCFLTHSRRRRSRHSSCRWQSSTSYRSWWSPSIVIFWSRRQSRRSSVNRQCYSAQQAAVSETPKKKNKNKNAKRSTNLIPRSCRLWSGLVPGNAIDIIILLLYPLLERWSFFWDGETNFCRRQSFRFIVISCSVPFRFVSLVFLGCISFSFRFRLRFPFLFRFRFDFPFLAAPKTSRSFIVFTFWLSVFESAASS